MWEVWNQRSAAVPCVDVHKLTTHRWKGHPRHRIHQWKYLYHHHDVCPELLYSIATGNHTVQYVGDAARSSLSSSQSVKEEHRCTTWEIQVLASSHKLCCLDFYQFYFQFSNEQYKWKYSHLIHCFITSVIVIIIIIIIIIITLWMRATASPSDIAPPTWILVE